MSRWARHEMLPEVGAEGQRKLLGARRSVPDDARGRVAADYLARAGLTIDPSAPPAPAVEVTAGRSELAAAADFVAGAWSALEAIKLELGVGQAARSPVTLTGPEP